MPLLNLLRRHWLRGALGGALAGGSGWLAAATWQRAGSGMGAGATGNAFNDGISVRGLQGRPGLMPLSAGTAFVLLRRADGTVYASGLNSNGALGIGTTATAQKPVKTSLPTTPKAVAVAAGGEHSLFLMHDGTVYAVGRNHFGQLGRGNTTNLSTPAAMTGVSGVRGIAAGALHSLLLRGNGQVWAVGSGADGRLGLGNTTNYSSVQAVPGLSNVVALACGSDFSLALDALGRVWATGGNSVGQLGLGDTVSRSNFTQITSVSNIVAISAGSQHSLMVQSNGRVLGMGSNSLGQLGTASTSVSSYPAPEQMLQTSNIVAVAAGNAHSLLLSHDGSVKGVGDNQFGQMADGYTSGKYSPVQLPISNAVAIAASDGSYMVRADGTVWASGLNTSGQLGVDSLENKKELLQMLL